MSDQMKSVRSGSRFTWGWEDLAPAFRSLAQKTLSEKNITGWLAEWTDATAKADETYNRLFVATTVNTADQVAERQFQDFMENAYPAWKAAEQNLKEKLLVSGLQVAGFEIPLRNMRAETDLFVAENLELQVKEEKINTEHDKVIGAQTVEWAGEERTVRQMETVLRETEREARRKGWEKMATRQLKDREAINGQWGEYMALRRQMASNAGMADYRAYRWQALKRFDYTPNDCHTFHKAIEETVVPATNRLAQRRRKKLGLQSLKYYDLFVDLSSQEPLQPFQHVQELTQRASAIFHQVHSQFGTYFDIMDREGLLDLDNRKNKAAGGYTADFSWSKRPFIFTNAVGIHDDVQTLLHEGGHAFHAFEAFKLPYFQQHGEGSIPVEFAEVASMAMEYLTAPYLEAEKGGFYSKRDAARAEVDHIETDLRFWPYMAIVDAFQHWAYEYPEEGANPHACDVKWAELEQRFRPYINWDGYEDVMMTGWQRKDHIHQVPFYYVEYGLALLGAVQVWRNAMADSGKAVAQYREALGLGGTATLPALFRTAGARFALDPHTLGEAVALMEARIAKLEEKY